MLRPAAAAEPGFPRDLVQAVLATAFEVILDRHLEAEAPGQLGLWTLRGLEVIEPELRPELRAGTLLLSDAHRLLGARPIPQPPPGGPAAVGAAGPLAVAVAALFDAAWRASPALRRAGAGRMLQNAFEELFNHLDPYSRYLTPAEAQAARLRRIGQAALGLRLAPGPGGSVLLGTVTPGGTADRAGLRRGDRLLTIDGAPVAARRLAEAEAMLEGPTGSAAVLRVLRGGRRLTLVLPREVVPPDTVHAERRDGILWLRIDGFANDTDTRLVAMLGVNLADAATRGIVLDLRGNRGGLLGQAVAVASAFLPGGPVARSAGRHPGANRLYTAAEVDHARGLPLVVLIDGRSASAAEIVAAALADRGRAVTLGSATMGKGLIQVVAPLPDGGELQVSWARVLAPSGWPIQGLGVLPALCTSLGEEATAAALAGLRRGDSVMAPALRRARGVRAPAAAAELAELRAICPPAEGRDADLGAARALLEDPGAYAAALAR